MKREIPNDFLFDFCRVTQQYGLKGKLSVVPMPGGLGEISKGLPGFPQEQITQWLDTVRREVSPNFSLCPEMLTHANFWDLEKGQLGDCKETEWSQTQSRESLTAYITRALEILKEAELPISGVSSPWRFGAQVQKDYELAISDAMANVFGKTDAWYALHGAAKQAGYRPKVVLNENGRRLVWFSSTVRDLLWQTIHTPEDSPEYISRVADDLITADGTGGAILDALNQGSYLIILTHWQSMFSNGTRSGLRALELVAQRMQQHLSDRVEWMKTEDLMQKVLDEDTV